MEISRYWRLQQQRYRLVGEVCPHCTEKIFPPRDVCPSCAKESKTPFQFSGKGEVYTFTIMRDSPPFPIAIIKLAEGPMITAQLTDVDNQDVRIGMPVEMVTRKLKEDGERGMLVYGYKFRPVLLSEK